MKKITYKLAVIIPTTRGVRALPTITSAFGQLGFSEVTVIVCGDSTTEEGFITSLEGKFKGEKLYIASDATKIRLFPGAARNVGLGYLAKNNIAPDYVLFLDDDICIPENYAEVLTLFLEKNKSAAVIGKVSSRPLSYWTTVIDYSNFWWLQMPTSVRDRGWLGSGATLMGHDDVAQLRFDGSAQVNEDSLFFKELALKTGKPLSYCAEVTAEHLHGRGNFFNFLAYQFNNGKSGVLFRGNGINLIMSVRKVKHRYGHAKKANSEFLKLHPGVKFGIFLSFIILQIGIEYGSLLIFLGKFKKYGFLGSFKKYRDRSNKKLKH